MLWVAQVPAWKAGSDLVGVQYSPESLYVYIYIYIVQSSRRIDFRRLEKIHIE